MIQTNEHINANTNEIYGFVDFAPDGGYAMWMDDEKGNLDPETGDPYCYWLSITVPNEERARERAPHIWAKLIDETMEIFGNTDPEQPVMKARAITMSLRKDQLDDIEITSEEESHTYIDENGEKRQKHGVY